MRRKRTKEQYQEWTESEYQYQLKIARKLQNRIFQAQNQFDMQKVTNLQKLAIHSYAIWHGDIRFHQHELKKGNPYIDSE